MRPSACLLAAALLSTSARSARAQFTEVQPGARVRIEAPGVVAGRLTGTVLSRARDSIVIGAPNIQPTTVPLARVTSLAVSRGASRSLGAIEGIKWGLPIGLGFGLLMAPSLRSCRTTFAGTTCGDATSSEKNELVLGSALGGLLWGAGIGALIQRERWEAFALPARTSLMLDGRHVGFSIALR